jgi:hypothetical protein
MYDAIIVILTSLKRVWHHLPMRTTLSLDDDVFQVVKRYAENRSLAIGKAVSELVRRGLSAPPKTRRVNGLVVFDMPEDSGVVTSELVKRLEADEL